MRLLTAQAIPDEGEIEILGLPVPARSKEARAMCGVVPQLDNLDVTLTVEENLRVFAYLYRLGRRERRPAVERALAIANACGSLSTRAMGGVDAQPTMDEAVAFLEEGSAA